MTDVVAISDFSDAFFDTSVLYKYALDQDSGSAGKALSKDSCESVVSQSVKREFDNVQTRREDAITSIRKALARGNLDSWSAPDSLGLSPHDENWSDELMDDIQEIASDEEIKERLKAERKKFKSGERNLFGDPNSLISETVNYPRSPSLSRLLKSVMGHGNDSQIICDAAAWSENGGTGNVVTSDHDHMLSNRDAIAEEVDRDRKSGSIKMASPEEFLKASP